MDTGKPVAAAWEPAVERRPRMLLPPPGMMKLLIDCLLKPVYSLVTCGAFRCVLQRGGGGAAAQRGLDQHGRQQGLLPAPPGRVEGRRAHRQAAHSPRPVAPQTQRAGGGTAAASTTS